MSKIKSATRPFFGVSGAVSDVVFDGALSAVSKKTHQVYYEEEVVFDWHSGMSWQVRQRSSESLARAILAKYGAEYGSDGVRAEDILEVSTASSNYDVGKALSAINLKYCDEKTRRCHSVENWFQAAKVFGSDSCPKGPYKDLLNVEKPMRYLNTFLEDEIIKQYKNDILFCQIQDEIRGLPLIRFEMLDTDFPLVPRSCFYDWLYVSALNQEQNECLAKQVMQYSVFTDIMFTPGTGKKQKFNTQARSCAIFVALAKRQVVDKAISSIDSFIEEVGYVDSVDSNLRMGSNLIQLNIKY